MVKPAQKSGKVIFILGELALKVDVDAVEALVERERGNIILELDARLGVAEYPVYSLGVAPHDRRYNAHLFCLGGNNKALPRLVGYAHGVHNGAVFLHDIAERIDFRQLTEVR